MNGISALIKEGCESSLGPAPSRKTSVHEPGSRPSLYTESASAFILDFPASRRVKNKTFFHKPMVFCQSSPKGLRQVSGNAQDLSVQLANNQQRAVEMSPVIQSQGNSLKNKLNGLGSRFFPVEAPKRGSTVQRTPWLQPCENLNKGLS